MTYRGVHNDEKRFPNPRVFDPSRYANDLQSAAEAALCSDATKRDHFLFGAGRRVCQGMHIAERSLFLAISRLLWAFDFELAEDENGMAAVPDAAALTEGIFVLPKKFPARLVPRNARKSAMVRDEWAKVEEKLEMNGQWKKVPEGMFFKEYIPLAT